MSFRLSRTDHCQIPDFHRPMIALIIACVVVLANRGSATPSGVVSLPCRDPDNYNSSACLFAGDHCDFVANFSHFYDQAEVFAKYITNPNPDTAEFVVESGAPRIVDGALQLPLIPPNADSELTSGTATIVSTTRFLHYGVMEATIRQSGHAGVVTSFIGFSNEKDEIDIEITGQDKHNVQTNWYYRGTADVVELNGASVNGYSGKTQTDNADIYHKYSVNWTQDHLVWKVDGVTLHSAYRNVSGGKGFPDTPMRISFGLWQAQEGSDWAGDATITNWTTPINAYFSTLSVHCLDRAGVTNRTARASTHPPTNYDPDVIYVASSSSAITTCILFLVSIIIIIFI
uniref:GH16 domain-containing protein n=1 Tax=Spongospora subterranea TaxID=70186 RepID=A0A0H5R421_9EUKA|eukprot:CRZ02774.1 hypothetical protein [Spongospora subterranea]